MPSTVAGHLGVRAHSRSVGATVHAALAYRFGTDLVDATGRHHSYARRGRQGDVLATGFAHGATTPGWQPGAQAWADAVDGAERRANSIVCRDVTVTIPQGLTLAQAVELVADKARALSERHDTVAAWAVHAPSPEGDESNQHAHILLATRALDPETGLPGKKLREFHIRSKHSARGDDSAREQQRTDGGGRNEIREIRAQWETLANAALERAGVDTRIAMGRLRDDRDRVPSLSHREVTAERIRWREHHLRDPVGLSVRDLCIANHNGAGQHGPGCATRKGYRLARHALGFDNAINKRDLFAGTTEPHGGYDLAHMPALEPGDIRIALETVGEFVKPLTPEAVEAPAPAAAARRPRRRRRRRRERTRAPTALAGAAPVPSQAPEPAHRPRRPEQRTPLAVRRARRHRRRRVPRETITEATIAIAPVPAEPPAPIPIRRGRRTRREPRSVGVRLAPPRALAPPPAPAPPRTIWHRADAVENAAHQLWQLLLAFVGLRGDAPEPAPPPEAYFRQGNLDDKIARAGTTLAQLKQQRQAAIDARYRPRTESKPEPADPLTATLHAIAVPYLGLVHDKHWRRARSAGTVEEKIAHELAKPEAGVPAAARKAVARDIARALNSFARDYYGTHAEGEPKEVPTIYDDEFSQEFAEAAGLPAPPQDIDGRSAARSAWTRELEILWRETREPELLARCQSTIRRMCESPSITPTPAPRPTPTPWPDRAPSARDPERW